MYSAYAKLGSDRILGGGGRAPADAEDSPRNTSVVEPIDPLDEAGGKRWDDLIGAHSDATVFHSAAWARVLVDAYEYSPIYLRISEACGNEMLLPCMEIRSAWGTRRGVSLPFTDFCEILGYPRDRRALFSALVNCARARRWKSIEVRGEFGDDSPPCASYYRHRLSLRPDVDSLFAKCAGVIRTNIRKAAKEGVHVEVLQSLNAVKEYYRLHCLTRKRHGIPPQPIAFFESIHKQLIAKGNGCVAIAYCKNRAIAGAVYLGFGTNAVFKFGASDYRYQHLRANSLVMWRAICHLRELGYATLCFGRTDRDAEGLRRFKSHWGTTEQTTAYHKYDARKSMFETARDSNLHVARQVLRHAPVPALRAIGAALYRYWG